MTREERNVVLFIALGILLGSLPFEGRGNREREPEAAGNAGHGVGTVRPLFPIDLNGAEIELLEELPGIGPTRARAIAESRESRGPYRSVEDLRRVRGIGPATVRRLRELVTVGDSIAPETRVGEEGIVDGTPRDASPRERGRQ